MPRLSSLAGSGGEVSRYPLRHGLHVSPQAGEVTGCLLEGSLDGGNCRGAGRCLADGGEDGPLQWRFLNRAGDDAGSRGREHRREKRHRTAGFDQGAKHDRVIASVPDFRLVPAARAL